MTLIMSSELRNLVKNLCYKLVGHLPGQEGLTKDALELHWGNYRIMLDPNQGLKVRISPVFTTIFLCFVILKSSP